MNFPDCLRIRVVETVTRTAISNVALTLRLKAPQKNDYFIGPLVTDESGMIEVLRTECLRTIETDQRMFVMDYSGDLASCGPLMELSLHSPEEIARMIRQFEQMPSFWGAGFIEPDKLFSALRTVDNAMFLPAHIFLHEDELLQSTEIEFNLQRR
jgi:hypothetical protein